MKLTRIVILATAMTTGALSVHAQATRFDFAYTVTDPMVNAFDDGRDMRIQLPAGTPLPIALTLQAGEQRLISPKLDGTYLVLPGLHAHVRLAWANHKTVDVHYSGEASLQRLGQGTSHGAVSPVIAQAPMQPPQAAARVMSQKEMEAELTSAEEKTVPPIENFISQSSAKPAEDLTTKHQVVPDAGEEQVLSQTESVPLNLEATLSEQDATQADLPISTEHLAKLPSLPILHISAGERLSVALAKWLQTRDMTMSWEATGSLPGRMRDVVLERDWAATDTDVVQTLTQVLEPFALNAQIVQQPSQTTVVIRNQSPAASASTSKPQ